MATLKRQKANGSWEFIEVVGLDIVNDLANKLDISVFNQKIKKDVPADAVFTDTKYTAGTNITISNGVISSTASGGTSSATKESIGLGNVDNIKQMPINDGILESYSEKVVTLAGTSPTINLSLANTFIHNLSGNTVYTISNTKTNVAHSFTLRITQGATARLIAFPTSVKWGDAGEPDFSKPNKSYILTFLTVDNGVNWEGMFGGAF